MPDITVTQLKYQYPLTEKLALKGLTFTIKSAEFIGIIGRNGAGKSTLCAALSGFVPHFFKGAYGGSVQIGDLNVRKSKMDTIVRKVGLVFQNPFTQLTGARETVAEELAFGLENLGIEKSEMKRRIDEAMDLLQIRPLQDRNPYTLSGGQMQRVAIASILVMQPEILILDEPTSQLDPEGTHEVFDAIKALSQQGMTIILAEHKSEELAQYADRIMMLDEGTISAFDTPERIFSLDQLTERGIRPPVYTSVCRGLDIQLGTTHTYPVTLEDAVNEVQKKDESD
ncbi:MAG: ABC transporter ATP-binding protein [Sporolactobacillus sp.]